MTESELKWRRSLSRRKALAGLGGFLAAPALAPAQRDPFRDHSRVAGLDEMRDVFDFEAAAYERLPRATYNFTARGGGTEFTPQRNRDAFDWVRLLPRAAATPGAVDTSSNVLGTDLKVPVMLAPSAAHADLHPDGEHATYAGCSAAASTGMIVSHVSSVPIGKIAKADGGPLWFQLYPREEIEQNREPLDAAQTAGCTAIVVTIDQQASFYYRNYHDRNLSLRRRRPSRYSGPTARYRMSSSRLWYEWRLFDELRPMVEVPILAKGLLTGEDAELAIEHGVDGIIVSNHGGRTLDYTPSTIEVLPEIMDAVRGRVPVLIDSGFRRGSDVLKGLALGAAAICVGRVPRWGLGSFGAEGVTRVMEIVQAELAESMRRSGVYKLADIDSSIVRTDFP